MCIVQLSNNETFKGAKKERLSLFKVKTQTVHKGHKTLEFSLGLALANLEFS
jgi:hypothetical protein